MEDSTRRSDYVMIRYGKVFLFADFSAVLALGLNWAMQRTISSSFDAFQLFVQVFMYVLFGIISGLLAAKTSIKRTWIWLSNVTVAICLVIVFTAANANFSPRAESRLS